MMFPKHAGEMQSSGSNNSRYTQSYNRRHHRVGHLMQGRYKAILVDRDSYLLELSRYVVLNPVRASMVQRPEDSGWSSYLLTCGQQAAPGWLHTDWILGQFAKTRATAQRRYVAFVAAGIGAEAGQSHEMSLYFKV
jgi:putative transposase